LPGTGNIPRGPFATILTDGAPRDLEERWMAKYCIATPIRFVGVWDTVGAVGFKRPTETSHGVAPKSGWKFSSRPSSSSG